MDRGSTTDPYDVVARVVASSNCSGCGACAALLPGLEMELDPASGYNRPVFVGGIGPRPPDLAPIDQVCPGAMVRSPQWEGVRRHRVVGPYIEVWEAWATDPAVREAGSSGGALTALAGWMLSEGEVDAVVGALADPEDPVRTMTTVSTRSDDAVLRMAGSRYAPASNVATPAAYDAANLVIGKPCEISAVRAAVAGREEQPVLFSFFCAGVPKQTATTSLIEKLGGRTDLPLRSLRYRGQGWPGRFVAVDGDGTEVSMAYDYSWGDHLGPTVQWRCKICPDGMGESADVVGGDFWYTDESGGPIFDDAPGRNVLIARNPRGAEIVRRAIRAGVIEASPVRPEEILTRQPYQARRRRTLAGRLLGVRLTGRPVPTYRGFSLIRNALGHLPWAARDAAGSFVRVKQAQRSLRALPRPDVATPPA